MSQKERRRIGGLDSIARGEEDQMYMIEVRHIVLPDHLLLVDYDSRGFFPSQHLENDGQVQIFDKAAAQEKGRYQRSEGRRKEKEMERKVMVVVS